MDVGPCHGSGCYAAPSLLVRQGLRSQSKLDSESLSESADGNMQVLWIDKWDNVLL